MSPTTAAAAQPQRVQSGSGDDRSVQGVGVADEGGVELVVGEMVPGLGSCWVRTTGIVLTHVRRQGVCMGMHGSGAHVGAPACQRDGCPPLDIIATPVLRMPTGPPPDEHATRQPPRGRQPMGSSTAWFRARM